MIRRYCIVFFLLLTTLGLSGICRAAEGVGTDKTITWLYYDLRPFYIQDGPLAGTGLRETRNRLLWKDLPNYQHRIEWANLKRIAAEMETGRQVVSGLRKTPEREKTMYFSIPTSIIVTHVLIVPKKLLKKIAPYRDQEGAVDLERLVRESGFRLAVWGGRSYTPPIDALLKRIGDAPNVSVRIPQHNALFSTLEMIQDGRLDGTIAYHSELVYLMRTEMNRSSFTSVPIKGSPLFSEGYLATPKTPWGKQVIEDINNVMLKRRTSKPYVKTILDWHDPSFHKQLRQEMQKRGW